MLLFAESILPLGNDVSATVVTIIENDGRIHIKTFSA
jgi:hypothetical protein